MQLVLYFNFKEYVRKAIKKKLDTEYTKMKKKICFNILSIESYSSVKCKSPPPPCAWYHLHVVYKMKNKLINEYDK